MRFFKRIWDKLTQPEIEQALIVLVPFVTFVIVAVILLPTILRLVQLPEPSLYPPDHTPIIETAPPAPSGSPIAEASPSPQPSPTPSPTADPNVPGWREYNGKRFYADGSGGVYTGLQSIGGKLYFFDQDGVAAEHLGIDVSFYNDFIDWTMVERSGIDFALLRVGGRGWETGRIYADAWFLPNLIRVQQTDIDIGLYFFSTATNAAEARQEAEFVLQQLNGMELQLPIYIDVEYSGNYPKGRADKLGLAQREHIIDAFCKRIEQEGYSAGVYTGLHYLRYELSPHAVQDRSLWLANYTRGGRRPAIDRDYHIWQFTENGHIAGISGKVDMNAIF